MSSPFGFVSGSAETVPFSARYTYPSQATKALQTIIKLPPKNGGSFATPPSGANIVRFEFPASGYLNPQRTTLSFDFWLDTQTGTTAHTAAWLQNNIKSAFRRVRALYGATPLEDIQNYNGLIRSLTEVVVPHTYTTGSGSGYIADWTVAAPLGGGVGGILEGMGPTNMRQNITSLALSSVPAAGTTAGSVTRYCVQLDLGILQQGKLIPLKWMSSQLAIEIEIAPLQEFGIILPATVGAQATFAGTPAGNFLNWNLVATLMEFDNSYDAAFFKGMMAGGIPIKFSSWHNTKYALTGTTNVLQIQERARSVKQAFACVRDQTASYFKDNGAMYNAQITEYQWRLGGVFFPSQPVLVNPLSIAPSATGITSSGAESFVELQKALGSLGEYQCGTNCDWMTYAGPFSDTNPVDGSITRVVNRTLSAGTPPAAVTLKQTYDQVPRFLIGVQFETTAGFEISGVNAEEQSDLQLTLKHFAAPSSRQAEVYVHFDALLVIRPNNEIDLIQ